MCTTASLSIHLLWASRLLPCPGYCNSAAVNNGIHVSLSVLVSSGCMPRSGIAGPYGGFELFFQLVLLNCGVGEDF